MEFLKSFLGILIGILFGIGCSILIISFLPFIIVIFLTVILFKKLSVNLDSNTESLSWDQQKEEKTNDNIEDYDEEDTNDII